MSEEGLQSVVKRGRPARDRSTSDLSVDEAHREGIVMSESRDPNDAVEQARVRVPLTSGQKLSLRGYKLDTKNYHYHWFQDDPGRIESAEEAFFEKCHMNGADIKAPSGGGYSYLMRLPIKYHLEDVLASHERRNKARQQQIMLKKGEYTVDGRGRPQYEGEMVVKRSTSTNPYAD